MERPRFFVGREYRFNNEIIINGDEFTHLNSVLRLRAGEQIDVCFNDGCVHLCEIVAVEKKQAICKIITSNEVKKRHSKISLFIALTKAERMDWAVQKCTELGIDEIIPFASEFCTVKDKGGKTDRLKRIALSASKQSGRVNLPEILDNLTFNQVILKLQEFPQIILAYENETASAKEIISKLDCSKDTAIIIGSEGGFSEKEVQNFADAGAKVVSLGETILRAETACVALVSAVNYEFNFWKRK